MIARLLENFQWLNVEYLYILELFDLQQSELADRTGVIGIANLRATMKMSLMTELDLEQQRPMRSKVGGAVLGFLLKFCCQTYPH